MNAAAVCFSSSSSEISAVSKHFETEKDLQNKLRFVISSACPVDMWEPFENRFETDHHKVIMIVIPNSCNMIFILVGLEKIIGKKTINVGTKNSLL